MTKSEWRGVLAVLVMISGPLARAGEPAASSVVPPDKLEWKATPNLPPGAQVAALLGAQGKPGPYAYRVKFPPHYRVPAHTHADDRTYTFLSGTYYQGHGDKFDPAHLTAVQPGSFETYAAGEKHYGETRDQEVIFQVNGNGPTSMAYVNPADDPRKK